MKIVLCPGTFDPITLGHVDIIERGLKIFDRVIIAVSQGAGKQAMFTPEERVEMIRETFRGRPEIEVKTFEGLLVDLAKREGVNLLLRGLRTVSDFEYEVRMAAANRFMADQVETFFMMTDSRYSHLSSSLIREIAGYAGRVTGMVPPHVEERLRKKIKR